MTALSRIRIVLVEPSHPGNIGASARAMKTMGLNRLVLVNPRRFPDPDANARASRADDLLDRAQVVADLPAGLSGCQLVIGASARPRHLEWPTLAVRAAVRRLLDEAHTGEVALVFGREQSGLTNEELARCHFLTHLETHPDYSSLNLAAAVQVFAHELRMASLEALPCSAPDPDTQTPAPAEALERFHRHLAEALFELEFCQPWQCRKLLRRLRRLFNRARPDAVEIQILRGILTLAQRWRRISGKPAAPADP
ncbi:MAG: RNA methyltransferase [Pseudomonadota bacterium]